MKSCLLTTNFPPVGGGVSRYNYGLVEASAGRIEVAGWAEGDAPPLGEGLFVKLKQVMWARTLAKTAALDTQLLASQAHLGLGCWIARRQFVQFVHGGEWEDYPMGRQIFRLFLRACRTIVFNSEATKQRLFPETLKQDHLVLKPGLPTFSPARVEREAGSKKNTPKDSTLNILAVSRLSPRKGLKRLVRAVELSLQARLSVSLRIVGTGVLGPDLLEMASNSDSISIDGALSDEDLIRAYDEADLFALLPEEISGGEAWEGFGIVFLEAAGRGLPILATSSGGIPEATCREGSILLSDGCSDREIAKEIHDLAHNHTLRENMAMANLRWAEQNTWATRMEGIDRMLRGPRGKK